MGCRKSSRCRPFRLWCYTKCFPCPKAPEDNDTCRRNLCSSGRQPWPDTSCRPSDTFSGWALMKSRCRDASCYYSSYCCCSSCYNCRSLTSALPPSSSGAPCRDCLDRRVLAGSRTAFVPATWSCTSPLLARIPFWHVRKPSDTPEGVYGNLQCRLACTSSTGRISSLAST